MLAEQPHASKYCLRRPAELALPCPVPVPRRLAQAHLLRDEAEALLSAHELERLAQQGVEGLAGAPCCARVGGHREGCDLDQPLLAARWQFGRLRCRAMSSEPVEHEEASTCPDARAAVAGARGCAWVSCSDCSERFASQDRSAHTWTETMALPRRELPGPGKTLQAKALWTQAPSYD